MVRKRKTQEASAEVNVGVEVPANNLRASLEKVKDEDGVVGYILRNSKLASIDLKDPSKIIDYAILSSSMFEAGEELCGVFDLGRLRQVYLEGSETRVLTMIIDENRLDLFTNGKVDPRDIAKKIL